MSRKQVCVKMPLTRVFPHSLTIEKSCQTAERLCKKPNCSLGRASFSKQCNCSWSRTKPSKTFDMQTELWWFCSFLDHCDSLYFHKWGWQCPASKPSEKHWTAENSRRHQRVVAKDFQHILSEGDCWNHPALSTSIHLEKTVSSEQHPSQAVERRTFPNRRYCFCR